MHYCRLDLDNGRCHWSDWTGAFAKSCYWEGQEDYGRHCATLGMLLDLGGGTLSVYQNGRRMGTLKDGLAGEYCWVAVFFIDGDVSIQRGYNVNTF